MRIYHFGLVVSFAGCLLAGVRLLAGFENQFGRSACWRLLLGLKIGRDQCLQQLLAGFENWSVRGSACRWLACSCLLVSDLGSLVDWLPSSLLAAACWFQNWDH